MIDVIDTSTYELRVANEPAAGTCKPWEMRTNTFGIIEDSGSMYSGALVLKVWEWIIAIDRVNACWTVSRNGPDFNIRPLLRGSVVTCIVK